MSGIWTQNAENIECGDQYSQNFPACTIGSYK